jgi:hypothetical protein
MNKNGTFWIKTISLTSLLLFILGYSVIQAKNVLLGPKIKIYSPLNGETYNNPFIEIKGLASNLNKLTLNDRTIFTDKGGIFSEKLILSPGYNIILLKAEDRFGKKTESKLELICNCGI